ncbi:ADP-ribosyltransferase [Actinomadura nitritigenes]|uniref:ADP-ribosyltransferase n=1 Tax=Actinomadura nitritigenes TaxID=134602 RepID=UPI003D8B1D1A
MADSLGPDDIVVRDPSVTPYGPSVTAKSAPQDPVDPDEPVDPSRIPVPDVHLADLEAAGRALKRVGERFARTSGDLGAAWRGLSAFYQAPEGSDLIAAMRDVPVVGDEFGGEARTVGDALLAFVDEVRPIVTRLHGLRAAATDFRAKVDGNWDGDFGDWRKNGDWVKENNRLNDAAGAALFQYQAAERACANKIAALFGGTHFAPDAAFKRRGDYAYGLAAAPKGTATPWGTPQTRDKPWYQDVGDGAHDFLYGVVSYAGSAVGANVYGETDSWGPAGTIGDWGHRLAGNWSGMLGDLGALAGRLDGRIDENGVYHEDLSAGQWWHNVKNGWTGVANALVPWQEWDDRPGYVLAAGGLNVGSLLYGGSKGVTKLNKSLRDLRDAFPKKTEPGLVPASPGPAPAPRFGFTNIQLPEIVKPRALNPMELRAPEGGINVPGERLGVGEILPDKGVKPHRPPVMDDPARLNGATGAADRLGQVNVRDLAESLRAKAGAAPGAASTGAATPAMADGPAMPAAATGTAAPTATSGAPAPTATDGSPQGPTPSHPATAGQSAELAPAGGGDIPRTYIHQPGRPGAEPATISSPRLSGPDANAVRADTPRETEPVLAGVVSDDPRSVSGQPAHASSAGRRPAHMSASERGETPGLPAGESEALEAGGTAAAYPTGGNPGTPRAAENTPRSTGGRPESGSPNHDDTPGDPPPRTPRETSPAPGRLPDQFAEPSRPADPPADAPPPHTGTRARVGEGAPGKPEPRTGDAAERDAPLAHGQADPPDSEQFLRFEGADGEAYGEQHYGHMFRALPEDQRHAVYNYTRGGVLNTVLRALDNGKGLGDFLNSLQRDRMLAEHLNGLSLRLKQSVNPSDLPQILRSIDLTPAERHAVQDVLNSPDPRRLMEIRHNGSTHELLERYLGETPTRKLLEEQIRLIDQAMSASPLPDPVQLTRSVGDLSHLRIHDGSPLGNRDPKLLEGTSHTEPGYTSASLGDTLFSPNIRYTIDVPAHTKGIWMGRSSAKPLEREFVLQRGLRYEIVHVERVGTDIFGRGQYHVHARVLRPDDVVSPETVPHGEEAPRSHEPAEPPQAQRPAPAHGPGKGAGESGAPGLGDGETAYVSGRDPGIPHAAENTPRSTGHRSESGGPKHGHNRGEQPSSTPRSKSPATGRMPEQGEPAPATADPVRPEPAGGAVEPGVGRPHHAAAPRTGSPAGGERGGHRPPRPEPGSVTSVGDALRRGVESGVDENRTVRLTGGFVAERVDLVSHNSGGKAVRKVAWAENTDWVDADELSALVGHAVEARVPVVHRADGRTLYLEYVEGEHFWETHPEPRPDVLQALYAGRPGARNLGLMDVLTGNGDRDWKIDLNGRLWGIDHGDTFLVEPDSAAALGGNPFSGQFVSGTRIGPRGEEYVWRPNELNPVDVRIIEQRLNALRSRFEALGHPDWFDGMMNRWESIKANASGTDSILGHDTARFGTAPETSTPRATADQGDPRGGTSGPGAEGVSTRPLGRPGATDSSRPVGMPETGPSGTAAPHHVNESATGPAPAATGGNGSVEPPHATTGVFHGEQPSRGLEAAEPSGGQRQASGSSPETRAGGLPGESPSEGISESSGPPRPASREHYGWYESDRPAASAADGAPGAVTPARPATAGPPADLADPRTPGGTGGHPGSESPSVPSDGFPGGRPESGSPKHVYRNDPTKSSPLGDELRPGITGAPPTRGEGTPSVEAARSVTEGAQATRGEGAPGDGSPGEPRFRRSGGTNNAPAVRDEHRVGDLSATGPSAPEAPPPVASDPVRVHATVPTRADPLEAGFEPGIHEAERLGRSIRGPVSRRASQLDFHITPHDPEALPADLKLSRGRSQHEGTAVEWEEAGTPGRVVTYKYIHMRTAKGVRSVIGPFLKRSTVAEGDLVAFTTRHGLPEDLVLRALGAELREAPRTPAGLPDLRSKQVEIYLNESTRILYRGDTGSVFRAGSHDMQAIHLWDPQTRNFVPHDGRGAVRTSPEQRHGLSDADTGRDTPAGDRAAIGHAREQRVADMMGGTVAKDSRGQDIQLMVPGLGSTGLDVRGPNGEYVFVGGPSRAGNRGKFGQELRIQKAAADRDGVRAIYFFEEGTPESALAQARESFGAGNVFTFPGEGDPGGAVLMGSDPPPHSTGGGGHVTPEAADVVGEQQIGSGEGSLGVDAEVRADVAMPKGESGTNETAGSEVGLAESDRGARPPEPAPTPLRPGTRPMPGLEAGRAGRSDIGEAPHGESLSDGMTERSGPPLPDPRENYLYEHDHPATGVRAETTDGALGAASDHPALDEPRSETAVSEPVPPEHLQQFLSDAEGEEYGENRLAHAFQDLRPPAREAVFRYSAKHKIALVIRDFARDPEGMARWFGDLQSGHRQVERLMLLGDGRMPSIDTLRRMLTESTELTGYDRRLVQSILAAEDPVGYVRFIENLDYESARMEFLFDGDGVEGYSRYIEKLDEALYQTLPEGLQAIRGLNNVRWMVDSHKVRLGNRDPELLVGAVQSEPAPMSTSLGVTPGTNVGFYHFYLHLLLPEGSQGLWIGRKSAFPNERELLLPRNTRYRIMNVLRAFGRERSAPGGFDGPIYDIWAEVIPPGR